MSAAVVTGCSTKSPPKLLWAEEFDSLDLRTLENPNGRWGSTDVAQPLGKGYADFGAGGHRCWFASPDQELGGVRYNPFSVRDSVVTITAQRTPAAALSDAQGCPWIGGLLTSNTRIPSMVFGYGYYEFKMRLPNPGRGMFPALWFYAADGLNPSTKNGAEIDLLEVFGDASGSPWTSSLHMVNNKGKGTARQAFIKDTRSTTSWHTYGLNWTSQRLGFYRDRKLIHEVTGPDAEFFAGCRMSIRMDYSMDAEFFGADNLADTSTPSRLLLEIDYVRKYARPF